MINSVDNNSHHTPPCAFFKVDTLKNKVPVQFPGCVELLEVSSVLNGNASKVIINPEYRSEASEDFLLCDTHFTSHEPISVELQEGQE